VAAASPAAAGAAVVAAAGRLRLALLFLVLCALPARAEDINDRIERINSFQQDIVVARDGTMDVHETITVNAQGDNIEHGIYRDFPTIYRGAHTVHVRFDVESTTLDGKPTPFETLDIANGTRLQMGDSDALLSHGLHIFVIHYVTDRQIGFFARNDELYWNVTGLGWDFEIRHAGTVIHLPDGARIQGWSFFTGPKGARAKDAAARRLSDNTIAFDTTAILDPNSGLTIAVDFTKGAVLPRPASAYLARDNAGAAGALAGLALLFVYFLGAWWLVGRDPKRGTIVPLFAPPHDLSPAAMRYVHRMQYDRKAFAATIVGLAVKGVVTITETKHFLGPVFTLVRAGEPREALNDTEAGVAQALVGWNSEIELTTKNNALIAMAIALLKKTLSDEYEKVTFNQNRAWVWPGLGIIGLSCVAAALLSDDWGGAFLVFLWGGLFGVATGLFGNYAFNAWRTLFLGHGARTVNLGIALLRTLAVLPFAGTLIGVLFFLNHSIQPVTVALLGLEGVVALVFYRLLRAPTRAGGKLRDEIDGFALFLKTTERDRLEMLQPPEMTPQLFEQFLPYAIALDCENAWSKKFELATATAGTPDAPGAEHHFIPMWYQGESFATLGASGFASSIGASLGNAAASASMAPGSGSGGGGGGGFSGGGGGGGGGGGW
jgi:hypothetical protein